MREINSKEICLAVRDLVIAAAHDLAPDIMDALLAARSRETGELAGNILELLLTNAEIASRERIPVCQDTGTGIIFLELGQEVHIRGDLNEALQEGVRLGYEEGWLRKSVCDPLTRENTGTNTPAVVHLEMVGGDRLMIRFLPKGCGSENMSSLVMLSPAVGTEGVVLHVIDQVVAAGSNPCPPVIVGVGLGGSFEKAALLAKKALLRPVGEKNPRQDVALLEERMLREINVQGQGVHGFGGITTALAVQMEIFPCHIASLPVAINIQCHAHRHKEIIL